MEDSKGSRKRKKHKKEKPPRKRGVEQAALSARPVIRLSPLPLVSLAKKPRLAVSPGARAAMTTVVAEVHPSRPGSGTTEKGRSKKVPSPKKVPPPPPATSSHAKKVPPPTSTLPLKKAPPPSTTTQAVPPKKVPPPSTSSHRKRAPPPTTTISQASPSKKVPPPPTSFPPKKTPSSTSLLSLHSRKVPSPKKQHQSSKRVPSESRSRKASGGSQNTLASDSGTEPEPEPEAAALAPGEADSTVAQPKAAVKQKRRNVFKPKNGSWLPHVGCLVLLRCVQNALEASQDYREGVEESDCQVGDVQLSRDDLRMLWFYAKKEFEDQSLEEIQAELKSFSSVSPEHYVRFEQKLKFKDQLPKTPQTAYLLYLQEVSPEYKTHYPNLTAREISCKIAKKWNSLPEEKKQKYKDQYQASRVEYDAKMKVFFEEHPEAKPKRVPTTRSRSRRRNGAADNLSQEEKRIKELRQMKPKPAATPYALFCKKKREALRKKYPSLNSKEITAKLSEKWKAMTDLDKATYRKEHIDSQAQYKDELKRFYRDNPDAEQLLANKTRKGKSAVSNSAAKAVPAPVSRETSSEFEASSVVSSEVGREREGEGEEEEEEEIVVESGESSEDEDSPEEEEGRRVAAAGGVVARGVAAAKASSSGGSKLPPGLSSEEESEEESTSESEDELVHSKQSSSLWPRAPQTQYSRRALSGRHHPSFQ